MSFVELIVSVVHLGKLLLNDVDSLRIAYTVSVVDNSFRQNTLVVQLEGFKSTNHHRLEVVNDLQHLLLVEELRVVLSEIFVVSGTEANDRRCVFVTNVETNQHSRFLIKEFRELDLVESESRLGDELLENLGEDRCLTFLD